MSRFTFLLPFVFFLTTNTVAQVRVLDAVSGFIVSDKSKNYNFVIDKTIGYTLEAFSFIGADGEVDIMATGKKMYLRDKRSNKQITQAEIESLHKYIKKLMLAYSFEEIHQSDDLSYSTFENNRNINGSSFFIVNMPQKPDEFFELLYLDESSRSKRLDRQSENNKTKTVDRLNNSKEEVIYTSHQYDESDLVFLDDPSFEILQGEHFHFMHPLKYWKDCGEQLFPNESNIGKRTKDVAFFGPAFPPSDGSMYLALVARQNASWEGLSQKLNISLLEGTCYEFDIDVRNEPDSWSLVKPLNGIKSKEEVYFGNPINLEVYLANEFCDADQEIYISNPIDHSEWKTYTVSFSPKETYSHIVLRANWSKSSELYNGNLMIDNIKNFREVGCGELDGK